MGQFQDTGSLPGSLDDLVKSSATAGWARMPSKSELEAIRGTIPYVYAMPGEGKPFRPGQPGADGQAGGDSVNADIKYE